MPVSVLLEGEYGINDVYLSVPTIINQIGAKEIVEIKLDAKEEEALKASADVVSSYYDALKD